jgi:hypothetical protein
VGTLGSEGESAWLSKPFPACRRGLFEGKFVQEKVWSKEDLYFDIGTEGGGLNQVGIVGAAIQREKRFSANTSQTNAPPL